MEIAVSVRMEWACKLNWFSRLYVYDRFHGGLAWPKTYIAEVKRRGRQLYRFRHRMLPSCPDTTHVRMNRWSLLYLGPFLQSAYHPDLPRQ